MWQSPFPVRISLPSEGGPNYRCGHDRRVCSVRVHGGRLANYLRGAIACHGESSTHFWGDDSQRYHDEPFSRRLLSRRSTRRKWVWHCSTDGTRCDYRIVVLVVLHSHSTDSELSSNGAALAAPPSLFLSLASACAHLDARTNTMSS